MKIKVVYTRGVCCMYGPAHGQYAEFIENDVLRTEVSFHVLRQLTLMLSMPQPVTLTITAKVAASSQPSMQKGVKYDEKKETV